MSSSKYSEWEHGRPALIEAHSLAKHKILGVYVQKYIEVLTAKVFGRASEFKLTLVDGFAGGGTYVDKSGLLYPGSPKILIDAVRNGEASANAGKTLPVKIDARFVFVEKNLGVLHYLTSELTKDPHWNELHPKIQLKHGRFDAVLGDILGDILKQHGKNHRALFVLDQYGYSDADFIAISRIFNTLPNSEIFLTVAKDWLLGFAHDPDEILGRLHQNMRLPREMIQKLYAPKDIEQAFETETPAAHEMKRRLQRLLHDAFTNCSGARFYTPFFITSEKSRRDLWFLHLANNERANDVVKEIHWEVSNHFVHFGEPGLEMLGFDPTKESPQLELFRFDDMAKSRQRHALMDQIPRRMYENHSGGITFRDLFIHTCNEMPATMDDLREVVQELCHERELEKKGGQGERRRVGTLVQDDDMIQPSKTKSLFPRSKK